MRPSRLQSIVDLFYSSQPLLREALRVRAPLKLADLWLHPFALVTPVGMIAS